MSLLSIVESVDSFPYSEDPFYYKFLSHDDVLLGYLVPQVASRFRGVLDVNEVEKTVKISPQLSTFDRRNQVLMAIANSWRKTDEEVARGWRDELYTVYHPQGVPYMLVERAFACILGVVTYGAHVNGYLPASKSGDGKLKMWIPRRSMTKATYPGKLDNTVAGGLAHPLGIWENVVKECHEEAGLSEEFVKANCTPVGVLSYLCQPYGPRGHAQPEVEYIYDLEFDAETVPRPVDGEAEDFQLMTIEEIHLRLAEFKPNCALVIIDFLIRHGFVTPENEPNYMEIVSRIHRRFPFATRN